jgi:serine/threonine protein kinase
LAVAYCHEQGVVHRDLKLENILLDDHCLVKLSDFGFTREFERGGLLDTFCGTTGYASPEMLLGQKYLGQGELGKHSAQLRLTLSVEVDIWSLGIILYALLTGTLPFDDDDEQEMKNKITSGEYEDPDWLSSGRHATLATTPVLKTCYRGSRFDQRHPSPRPLETPHHATNPLQRLVLQTSLSFKPTTNRNNTLSAPRGNGQRTRIKPTPFHRKRRRRCRPPKYLFKPAHSAPNNSNEPQRPPR